MPANLVPYIREKGSVTIDGISLPINSLKYSSDSERFYLTILPHGTDQATSKNYQVGTQVNIINRLNTY